MGSPDSLSPATNEKYSTETRSGQASCRTTSAEMGRRSSERRDALRRKKDSARWADNRPTHSSAAHPSCLSSWSEGSKFAYTRSSRDLAEADA